MPGKLLVKILWLSIKYFGLDVKVLLTSWDVNCQMRSFRPDWSMKRTISWIRCVLTYRKLFTGCIFSYYSPQTLSTWYFWGLVQVKNTRKIFELISRLLTYNIQPFFNTRKFCRISQWPPLRKAELVINLFMQTDKQSKIPHPFWEIRGCSKELNMLLLIQKKKSLRNTAL